jgi:hypothetical protein
LSTISVMLSGARAAGNAVIRDSSYGLRAASHQGQVPGASV